jgi:hypothetical protein
MMANNNDERNQIQNLVNTSVQDMQSGLWQYTNVDFLKKALAVVKKRGEKTKVKVLEAKIRKLEKA